MSVTTAIVLDKRRTSKKTNSYPVCLRVTFKRDARRFAIVLSLAEADFGKLSSPHPGEYVEWGVTAKRAETRTERVKGTVERLKRSGRIRGIFDARESKL